MPSWLLSDLPFSSSPDTFLCTTGKILLGYHLDNFHRFPWWFPWSWGKRIYSEQDHVIGRLFMYHNVPLDQKLPDVLGVVNRYFIMVKQPQIVLPRLSSLLVHWAKHLLQDFHVDLQIDRLFLWQEFAVNNALDIKERNQHEFEFWL